MKADLASLDAEPLAGQSGVDLCRRRSDAFDRAVRALAGSVLPADVTLLAVGGYGRGEMCPGSDVDLLFVPHPGFALTETVVEPILYPLWDAGVRVSHAVRVSEECTTESRADIKSLTALLDGRLLIGLPATTRRCRQAAAAVAREDEDVYFERLAMARTDRERRFGRLAHTIEGDLKESVGGLRDASSGSWYRAITMWPEQAVEVPDDPALDLFLLVRTALHRISGPGNNRLAPEHHAATADLLGIRGRDGWEPADVLVRTIADHARRVALGIEWDHRMGWGKEITPGLRAIVHAAGGVQWRVIEDPSDLEAWCRRHERVVWNRRLRRVFLDRLSDPMVARTLEALEASDVLDRLIPEWQEVRGRPQRDPYHRFPVDIHLIQAVAHATRLLRQPDEPFAQEAVRTAGDPRALLLGALLHDIGKVGKGSHVPIGVEMAGRVLDRMGVDGDFRDDVLFLVREHLLLSDTATRRNLQDEDLILHVAARIGDERRLALLYLLTVADAEATGPSASTPWRMGLIRDLVGRVQRAFERGLMDPRGAERIGRAERAVRRALQGLPPDEVERFIRSVPPGYLLWVAPEAARLDLQLFIPRPGPEDVHTDVRPGSIPGTTRLMVGAIDRLGLLASIAGALAVAGISTVSAQAFTTEDGFALDAFDVRGAFEPDIPPARWARFRESLDLAREGRLDLAERVRELRSHYRPPPTNVPVTVRIDQEASDYSTLVEVGAADRLGLLFDLARTLAQARVDVHAAKVATYGPRVLDVFYVTDADGGKLDATRSGALQDALTESAST